MAKGWLLIFKTLTIAVLLALWWAVFSVDLSIVKKERRRTDVVESERKRVSVSRDDHYSRFKEEESDESEKSPALVE